MKTTNVLAPTSAHDALAAIQKRSREKSRNKTLHRLLVDYVAAQSARAPADRLMHLATLLRHPLPRREADLLGRDAGRRLPVLVDDGGTWDAARALGFALPGQSLYRGHPQYQARRGTDAVLTAIACVEPLRDPVLGDAPQLLTHRQALGLWRLVIASTRTAAEDQIYSHAEQAAANRDLVAMRGHGGSAGITHPEFIVDKLDATVTWHSQFRFNRAAEIVSARLSGNEQEFLRILDEQGEDDDTEWLDEIDACRMLGTHEYNVRALNAHESKGETAVRRAERDVALDAMVGWIATSGRLSAPSSFSITIPRTRLQRPNDWTPTPFPADAVPAAWTRIANAGHVLQFELADTTIMWPSRITPQGTTEPIPGFAAAVDNAPPARHRQLAEAVLLDLTANPAVSDGVSMPAHIAHHFGLITASHRDEIVADATHAARPSTIGVAANARIRPELNHDLLFADLEERLPTDGERAQARLAYAHGHQAMVRYLKSIEHPGTSTGWLQPHRERENDGTHRVANEGPAWTWHPTSVADLIDGASMDDEVVRWLTAYVVTAQSDYVAHDAYERWRLGAEYGTVDHPQIPPAVRASTSTPRPPGARDTAPARGRPAPLRQRRGVTPAQEKASPP